MKSRDSILQAVKTGKPDLTTLPERNSGSSSTPLELLRLFIANAQSIGAKTMLITDIRIVKDAVSTTIEHGRCVISNIEELPAAGMVINSKTSPAELALLDEYYVNASIGVAESGAVWIEERHMVSRILPFICGHLKVLLCASSIVSTLDQACRKVAGDLGYGVFVAGPSKTADIEQALVIGAHGAKSMEI